MAKPVSTKEAEAAADALVGPPVDSPTSRAYAAARPECPACTRGKGLHSCGLKSLQARFWGGKRHVR